MKLFSLTQTLFGYHHEREDDHWVRKRNGQTLHPGDLYHPETYGTKARIAKMRPRHMHYEPDNRDIDKFYAPRGRRERPSSPEPLVVRRERRAHGWQDIEEPPYERYKRRSSSPVVLYREPQHINRKSRQHPSYDHPAARSPSPAILYREPLDVATKSWEEPSFERHGRRQAPERSPQPHRDSLYEHHSIRERTIQRRATYQESDIYGGSPRSVTRGRARSPPSSPFSTASTLIPSMYEPDPGHYREDRHRDPPPSPRPEHRRVRFASPTRAPRTSHLDGINPHIKTIQANANHHDSREALARLETLAFRVYPVMHKYNLRVDTLLELDDSLTTIDGWNSGCGKEISIKVRTRHRVWRSMDEMVDSMMGELAHNVYRARGREWYALRERLRTEVGRSGRR